MRRRHPAREAAPHPAAPSARPPSPAGYDIHRISEERLSRLASLPPLRGKDRMGDRAMPARLASLARERRNATNAERRLWRRLRRKEVRRFRFSREAALRSFMADFVRALMRLWLNFFPFFGLPTTRCCTISKRVLQRDPSKAHRAEAAHQGFSGLKHGAIPVLSLTLQGDCDLRLSGTNASACARPPIPTFPHKGGWATPAAGSPRP